MMTEVKRYPATILLLALTVLVFLGMQVRYGSQATSSFALLNSGAMYGDLVRAFPQQIWRLISPIVVHIGWEHFLLNSLTLYFLGRLAEGIWGSLCFFILYLLAGMTGNLLTMALTPHVIAAGASTSLFGLFAAIVTVGYLGQNPYLKALGRSYLILIVFNLIFNLMSPGISLVGHIGGLLGGAFTAMLLPIRKVYFFPKNKRLVILCLFVFTGLAFLLLAFR